MTKYRSALPQLNDELFLTDGGLETTLMFHEGVDLPDFAAFHLLRTPEGEAVLDKYFRTYAEIAKGFGAGLILESATWRANADWGDRLGYTAESLAEANRRAIRLLEGIRDDYETARTRVVISGCMGPRRDGYAPDRAMSERAAESYHRPQVETLAATAVDMVCALTMTHAEEAVGIVRAARGAELPVAISFTVETDGNLPSGQSLQAALEHVDEATSGYVAYYMINCAHPTHFDKVLSGPGPWLERLRGVRANASRKSHAELNEASELDAGNPTELGAQYADLRRRLRRLNVMGGCCGTDHRHVTRIAEACSGEFHLAIRQDGTDNVRGEPLA